MHNAHFKSIYSGYVGYLLFTFYFSFYSQNFVAAVRFYSSPLFVSLFYFCCLLNDMELNVQSNWFQTFSIYLITISHIDCFLIFSFSFLTFIGKLRGQIINSLGASSLLLFHFGPSNAHISAEMLLSFLFSLHEIVLSLFFLFLIPFLV